MPLLDKSCLGSRFRQYVVALFATLRGMTTSVNCSFTDQSNIYYNLYCGTSNPYCCTSGPNKTCSDSVCSDTAKTTSESILLFWILLATVGGTLILVIFVIYLICLYQKPREASRDSEREICEEIICETQIRTVTTRKLSLRDAMPNFFIRNENFKRVTTRHKSRVPVRVVRQFERSRPNYHTGSSTKRDNSTSPRETTHERSDSRRTILKTGTHLPDVIT